ncbi:GNAT family N-acetyltransferase [Streptomyces hydrogenans]|uniref:N-acetyltransferase n=1 Tax=Streptomyces hydrogenans TaxID=1873719 RepID=A0ABQ3PS90_9ACTN|nr:GNAT family N-acetyltransferase [Streptomyces hydrogenans]GHE30450.1 N-acetyltransferase [Streptomyces hydrogenans]GHI27876.1 N-acetyltransferase [Streptomyces hydrogenans]
MTVTPSRHPAAALRTERLELRPVRSADLPAVTRLWTDPEVRRHLGGPVIASVVRIRQRRIVGAPGFHAVVRAEDRAVLGLVTVEPAGHGGETEVSYQFLPEHWGSGYAREAVAAAVARALETVPSVVAVTQEANARSRRLLEAVGLEHEESFEEWGARQVLYRRRA